jgi:integrase
MQNPLSIRRFQLQSGERMATLVDNATGIPLLDPNLYALKSLRSKALAVNTIEAHLRAIMLLELLFILRDIDLSARLRVGSVLHLFEVESIVDNCKEQISRILELLALKDIGSKSKKVSALSPFKALPPISTSQAVSSYRDRVAYIRDYINDRALRALTLFERDDEKYLRLEAARVQTFNMFDARIPARRKPEDNLKSLTEKQIYQLWQIVEPWSDENPFRDKFVRYRNALLIQWFILLGLRRGELLGVRIEDINWQQKTVSVVRRQDSKKEKRALSADAKTYPGDVPISDDLLTATHEYLTEESLRPSQAKDDDIFLFVPRGGGALTFSGLHHVFRKIRETYPELPKKLSPQICRHTCNYILSVGFDKEGVTPAEEAQRRRVLMRWSPTSVMPDHYNRRRIKEKADASARKAQIEQYAKRQGKGE